MLFTMMARLHHGSQNKVTGRMDITTLNKWCPLYCVAAQIAYNIHKHLYPMYTLKKTKETLHKRKKRQDWVINLH